MEFIERERDRDRVASAKRVYTSQIYQKEKRQKIFKCFFFFMFHCNNDLMCFFFLPNFSWHTRVLLLLLRSFRFVHYKVNGWDFFEGTLRPKIVNRNWFWCSVELFTSSMIDRFDRYSTSTTSTNNYYRDIKNFWIKKVWKSCALEINFEYFGLLVLINF